MPRLLLAALLAILPSLAPAGDAPLVITYDLFELTIPHSDLAVCPEPLAAPTHFCRLVVNNGELHVFAFSEDGDQPLIAVQSWSTDLLEGLLD